MKKKHYHSFCFWTSTSNTLQKVIQKKLRTSNWFNLFCQTCVFGSDNIYNYSFSNKEKIFLSEQKQDKKIVFSELRACKNYWDLNYCSDFRYESNGIFVLGVGFFFLQTNFDFLTSHFWRNFLMSFKRYCCPELKFEKIFHLWSFFVKLWGFKYCHFDQFGTINERYNSRY